ncbi:MAG: right-handed parallel beta-helix repeat-containing protein [Pirellulales bacterium]
MSLSIVSRPAVTRAGELPDEFASQRAEVADGARTTARADWWGFDEADSTGAIQAAIDSGAPHVVVPYVAKPWIVRPLTLRNDLEFELEPGVLLLAKKDEFRGRGDSLLSAIDLENVTIRGFGAVLRMRKSDYQQPPYEKAEWRMGIRIAGSQNVLVEGLRIESSGGDGIYVGSSGKHRWAEDVTLRDCVCYDNHRQGLSVVSAQNLLVERCTFSHTDGTAPEAGIDLEPDSEDERLANCVIRDCVFEHNSGHAILVYMKPLTSKSEPVSVRFENCVCRMGTPGMTPDDFTDASMTGWAGISVGAVRDDGPQGLIEFVNCTSENTGKEGVKIFDKSADGVRVRFVDCRWGGPWVARHREYAGPRAPVLVHVRRSELTRRPGGIDFENCQVFNDTWTAPFRFEDDGAEAHLTDVHGSIRAHGSRGFRPHWGPDPVDVDLKLIEADD